MMFDYGLKFLFYSRRKRLIWSSLQMMNIKLDPSRHNLDDRQQKTSCCSVYDCNMWSIPFSGFIRWFTFHGHIEMSNKRQRDVATPNVELIEIYEDLANESEDVRLRAAHKLLSEFSRPNGSSQEKLKVILRRLFRGLCSSRKAARLGFSIALTEFLAQIFQYPVEETGLSQNSIVEILDKQTASPSNTSGQVCSTRAIILTMSDNYSGWARSLLRPAFRGWGDCQVMHSFQTSTVFTAMAWFIAAYLWPCTQEAMAKTRMWLAVLQFYQLSSVFESWTWFCHRCHRIDEGQQSNPHTRRCRRLG